MMIKREIRVSSVNDLLRVLSDVPEESRDRPIAIYGTLVEHSDVVKEFDVMWVTCKEGVLIYLDR